MSAALPRWLSNRPPVAAVEINPRRVTAAVISGQGGSRVLSSYAGEPLNKGLYANQYASPGPTALAAWLNERGATAVVLADPVRAQFEPMLRSVGARVAYEGGGVSVWRSPTSTWAARPPG